MSTEVGPRNARKEAGGDGQPGSRRSIIGDVAALAGVSQMTVSRVMNDRPGVRSETRDRVVAAIRELDYRPNIAARSLVTGRTNTLGVISVDATFYGPASTLNAIEVAAREAGYYLSVATLQSLGADAVAEAFARLSEQAVEGVLVIAPHASVVEGLSDLSPKLPIIALEGGMGGDASVVAVDQRAGATAATEHLLRLGHHTVMHLAGPENWLEARARREAWADTLRARGLTVPSVLVGDWSAEAGYEHGKTLAADDAMTAVFVANDQMALGVLRALHEAGRRVPQEVSVVGFDDVPEAAYFTPPLTTVRQDFREVGRRALELLLGQLRGQADAERRAVIAPQLVVRASTGPLPPE